MRNNVYGLVVVFLAGLFAAPAHAQVPGGAVWKVDNVYCDPPAPAVGATYALNVVVWSKTAVETKVAIVGLPSGDTLLGKAEQRVTVGPGSYTFRFEIRCGVVSQGTVTYDVRPLRVVR